MVYGDSGYLGVEKQAAAKDDPHLSTVEFWVNKRPKSIRENSLGTNWEKAIEHGKSSVRSKVEQPFLIVKRLFGYATVVYRGLNGGQRYPRSCQDTVSGREVKDKWHSAGTRFFEPIRLRMLGCGNMLTVSG